MPRKPTTPADRRRADDLTAALRARKERQQLTVEEIAQRSGVGYETVRSTLAGRNVGTSFFIVADLAKALDVSLDALADASRTVPSDTERSVSGR